MKGVHRLRSLSALLILALLLCAPWSVEAGPSAVPCNETTFDLHLFLDWLAGFWGDADCTFDPNGGGCRDALVSGPATGSDSIDNGCGWDPNGGACREILDEACGWDPNGGGCRGGQ